MVKQNPPRIGRNIQHLRKGMNYTLSNLAERSGVSKAMLSQIESEKVNPTVATVWKIAQGLGVDINALLSNEEEPNRKFHVSRKENFTVLDTDEEGLHIRVLSPVSMVEDLEMYLLTFLEGGCLVSAPHFPETEEFLTVLKGAVEVTAGENTSEIREGDFIRYHCDIDHSIRNIAEGESAVHMVVRFNRKLTF